MTEDAKNHLLILALLTSRFTKKSLRECNSRHWGRGEMNHAEKEEMEVERLRAEPQAEHGTWDGCGACFSTYPAACCQSGPRRARAVRGLKVDMSAFVADQGSIRKRVVSRNVLYHTVGVGRGT